MAYPRFVMSLLCTGKNSHLSLTQNYHTKHSSSRRNLDLILKPHVTRFGLIKVILTVTIGINIGVQSAKYLAQFLDEYHIFNHEYDDDDDDNDNYKNLDDEDNDDDDNDFWE